MPRPHTQLALLASICIAASTAIAQTSPPGSITVSGFTLRSAGTDLPMGSVEFPAGAGQDVVQQNCVACHSAGMVLTQPNLTRTAWEAEVAKMQNVYKAPVEAADVPAIVTYLASIKGTP